MSKNFVKYVLYEDVVPNLPINNTKPYCTYDHILQSSKTINIWDVPKKFSDFSATGIANGSFVPDHCTPLFSVAILVTIRNRLANLAIFLPYMHNFLRKQNIHYKVYLIEQQNDKPFNKGLLYNIGARFALQDQFPCLILHDVDLLPLNECNLYACLLQPRHLSANVDKFHFTLPYEHLVGGVLALRAEVYQQIGGFSNRFNGWGGEDDDFYERITAKDFKIQRFPLHMSQYTMLPHPEEPKNRERFRILSENRRRRSGRDGLHDLRLAAGAVDVTPQTLATLISVKL